MFVSGHLENGWDPTVLRSFITEDLYFLIGLSKDMTPISLY